MSVWVGFIAELADAWVGFIAELADAWVGFIARLADAWVGFIAELADAWVGFIAELADAWVGFIAELADAWVDVVGSPLSLILGTGEVKVDEGEGCNLPKISKWLEVVTLEDLCDDINACIPPLPSVSFDNWTTSSSPSCIPGLEAL